MINDALTRQKEQIGFVLFALLKVEKLNDLKEKVTLKEMNETNRNSTDLQVTQIGNMCTTAHVLINTFDGHYSNCPMVFWQLFGEFLKNQR
jgi:hypothetical protein